MGVAEAAATQSTMVILSLRRLCFGAGGWPWSFHLLFAVIAVGLVWRYGAANLSLRDRVVAHPPNTCVSPSAECGGI